MEMVTYTTEIVDTLGKPVPNARVVTSWDKVHQLAASTDARGRASFKIPKGYCLLYVRVDHWKVQGFRNVFTDTTERFEHGRSLVG